MINSPRSLLRRPQEKKSGAIDNLPSELYVEGHRCIIVDGIGSSVLCRH